MTVASPVVYTRDWRGLFTGFDRTHPTHAGLEHAVLVLGPPRCGKTSGVVVPCITQAPGAAVSTSTKSDVLEATGGYRAAWGRCYVFDPVGSVALPRYALPLRWSPVTGCELFERAVATAHSLASAARPGAALSEAAHWVERAEALLAPLLHAAALSGRNLADVVRWVLGHDLTEPGRILSSLAADMPRIVLAGVVGTEERERSGIMSTTAGLLSAYRSEAALQAACAPNFDPGAFASSSDTVFICAPAHAQEQLAPLIVTLIDQIRSAVYYRARDAAPVVLALDEVAQIAPLPSLPAIAAEGGGQGLVTLACLQDLSQARSRWGPAAEGFFSLFATKLVFPGLGDQRTLELISALAGEHQVPVRSVTRPRFSAVLAGKASTSTTTSFVWRRELPLEAVARGVRGCALRVRSDMPPHYVGVPPWWQVPDMRDLLMEFRQRWE